MSAHEKFAWVWLVTMVTTYTAYFAGVIIVGEAGFLVQLGLFAATTIVQIIIVSIAAATIWLRKGEGRETDERDRAIAHRSTKAGYGALMAGLVVVGCILPFSRGGWELVHAAVFAIALAEIIRHILIVTMYRRGWHG